MLTDESAQRDVSSKLSHDLTFRDTKAVDGWAIVGHAKMIRKHTSGTEDTVALVRESSCRNVF